MAKCVLKMIHLNLSKSHASTVKRVDVTIVCFLYCKGTLVVMAGWRSSSLFVSLSLVWFHIDVAGK